MALTIIALVIALAAIAFAVFNAVRIHSLINEAEQTNWRIKGVEAAMKADKDKPEALPVAGLECASYDPEKKVTTFEGNVVVKGFMASGGIKEKK